MLLRAETRDWVVGPEGLALAYLGTSRPEDLDCSTSSHGIALSELLQMFLLLDILVWCARQDPPYVLDKASEPSAIRLALRNYPSAALKVPKTLNDVRLYFGLRSID